MVHNLVTCLGIFCGKDKLYFYYDTPETGVIQCGCFGTGIISPRNMNNVFFIELNKLYKIPIFYLNLKYSTKHWSNCITVLQS